jgi:acetyl esterase/lipase
MESMPLKVGKIQDLDLGHFNIRVFSPQSPGSQPDNWPVFIWFHGGGWAVGDVTMSNDMCALICNRASCCVVTVGYRLAPENPFPAAFHDAIDALLWVHSDGGSRFLQIDRSRIAIGGTSAGGQLAASLVMKAAAMQPPIPVQFQLLVVPVIDNQASVEGIWARNSKAPWLTPARMLWYRRMYLPNECDWAKWEASPNLASDELLSRTPKTWIAVSEQDLLAPEAVRYASQLRAAWDKTGAANNHVEVRFYIGCTHSILAMSGM